MAESSKASIELQILLPPVMPRRYSTPPSFSQLRTKIWAAFIVRVAPPLLILALTRLPIQMLDLILGLPFSSLNYGNLVPQMLERF